MHPQTNLQNWWSRGGVMPAIRPDMVPYFFGKITREQAEELLAPRSSTEGLFLLRESVAGNFAVSICHKGRVHHYNVERVPEGGYRIPMGPKFAGPVELVLHHAEHLDGFLTLARHPLERGSPGPEGILALQEDITMANLEELLRVKALEVGLRGRGVEEAVNGPMRDHLRQLVLQELHFTRSWYHDDIRRKEAERRLAIAANTVVNPTLKDGLYL